MNFDHAVWLHIGIGVAALALFWRTLAATKGSPIHRRFGRGFFVVMLLTVLTVVPVVLLRPTPFDPGRIVMLVYLSACVFTVVTIAWTAIRWKERPDRFRGLHFKLLGPLLVVLGVAVLAAGSVKGDPVAVVLSWVGLAYGTAMIVFARSRAPLHPRWWLSWHLSAVCGLLTAVHGTLLFVAWRWAFDPSATRGDAAAFHVAVLVAGLALRGWQGRSRGVPWGWFAPLPLTRRGTQDPSRIPVEVRAPTLPRR